MLNIIPFIPPCTDVTCIEEAFQINLVKTCDFASVSLLSAFIIVQKYSLYIKFNFPLKYLPVGHEQDNFLFPPTDWVDVANDLLSKCHINLRLMKLADCDADVFIALYENILGEKVPGNKQAADLPIIITISQSINKLNQLETISRGNYFSLTAGDLYCTTLH